MEEEKKEIIVSDNKQQYPEEKEKGFLAKSVDKAGSLTTRVINDFNSIRIPQSLNWFFSLGFKIGIFVIIKDYLVLRRQIGNLSRYGYAVIIGQFLLALIMIALGVILQNPVIYDQPGKMKRATLFYFVAGIINFGTYLYGKFNDARFFIVQSVTPGFKGILQNLFSGFKEFSLSFLFADLDIWAVFAILLFVITEMYLYVTCDELKLKKMQSEESAQLTEERKKANVRKVVWALAISGLIAVFAFGIPYVDRLNKIEIPYAASEYKNKTYGSTVQELMNLGFKNFVIETDNNKNNDKIKYISINETDDFDKGQYFGKNAEIHIIFYSNNVEDITVFLNETKKITVKNGMDVSSYTVKDEEIATVDENGVVTGLQEGNTTISVMIGDITYICEVTVRERKWYDGITASDINMIVELKEKASSTGQSIKDFLSGEEGIWNKIKGLFGNKEE